MSEPENYTTAQAADPQTPAQVLADIAALRPDLRPAVAANPSTYPGLLEWLASLGEPSVDAALAARQSAGAPHAGAAPAQQPQYAQPQPQYAQPQPQYGQAQPPYGQSQPPYGQSQPQAPYGQPQQPGGYGYGPGAPAPKKSHKTLWIVLGVVGVLIVLGIVAVVLVANAVRGAIAEFGTYGSDSSLDALYDRCEDGDWAACDDLYWTSPAGSAYEDFGGTCGNRTAGDLLCVDEMADPGTEPDVDEPDVDPGQSDGTYGDDPYLDGLWDACEGGDMQACDDLYMDSDFGTEYETFGDTCGGRQAEGTGDYCVG